MLIVGVIETFILFIGILVPWWIFRREQRELTYRHFVDVYMDIATHLPSSVFFAENSSEPRNDANRRWMLAYVDLCSEEVKLKCRKRIDDEVFADWKESILATLKKPHFIRLMLDSDTCRTYKVLTKFLVCNDSDFKRLEHTTAIASRDKQ